MTSILYEDVAWIYKMFITFIVAVIAIGIVGTTIVNSINTREVQKDLLLNRILYSPDGFWEVKDATLIPGVIDLAKFNQNTMSHNFQYPAKYGGVKITLVKNNAPYSSLYINKDTFDTIKEQVTAGIKNTGLVETHVYPVVIQGTGMENGYLVVQLALPEEA